MKSVEGLPGDLFKIKESAKIKVGINVNCKREIEMKLQVSGMERFS